MSTHILVIDDELPNLLMLEEYLSDTDYNITSVQSAQEGISHLQSGAAVDLILLDRMMPEMNGMDFLATIKHDNHYKHIPVIMQTAAAAQDEIAEGIAAGVFYYLTKPFKKNVLISIIKNALKDFSAYQDVTEQLHYSASALKRLDQCHFSFQTLEDVNHISLYLANLYPQANDAILGIKELMLNAIEHGNLGIHYDEKTELNTNGTWEAEINKRLTYAENHTKYAYAKLEKSNHEIVLTLEDQGKGFDWKPYMQIAPERATDNHGRGIAMSAMISFDEIRYIPPGNKVVCRKKLD